MGIIQKLIIKEWFKFFFAALIALILLLTIADLVTGLLRSNVTPREVILNYFIEFPSALAKTFPISCLIASLFSINKLRSRNELTAIFAGGFSLFDYLITVVFCSIIVGIILIGNLSIIQPYFKSKRHRLIKDSEVKFQNLKKQGFINSAVSGGRIWFKSSEYFFTFQSFDKRRLSLIGMEAYFLSRDHLLSKYIKASAAKYRPESQTWELSNVLEYKNLDNTNFTNPVRFKTQQINLSQTPNDFIEIQSDISTLNLIKLYDYINRLKEAGINTNEYQVILYDKIAGPIMCILFSLLSCGALFSPSRRGSSMGKNLAVIFSFTLIYWLINSYFLELGYSSKVLPFLSVFTLPFIFLFGLFVSFIIQSKKI
jgi:lipopolysaccharide export system permease protein